MTDQNGQGYVFLFQSTAAVAGTVREERGIPVQRFRKELVKTGRWVKGPTTFEITETLLDHWVATFQLMTANGVRVPCPATHEGQGDPDKNRGWVVDMFREGGSLVALVDLVGEDGLAASRRSDVSIFSPASFTDGKGNEYRRPIIHVALCTDPVISGLGEFERIAASLQLEESSMDWKKIKEALGIKEEMKDENAETLVLSAVGVLDQKVKDAASAMKASDDKTKTIQTALDELKLSGQEVQVDPVVLKLVGDARRQKLDALVTGSRITKSTRDKLVDVFLGKDDAALSLSIQRRDENLDKLLDILADNKPAHVGEQTGPQTTVVLSGGAKVDDSPLVKDAEKRAVTAAK